MAKRMLAQQFTLLLCTSRGTFYLKISHAEDILQALDKFFRIHRMKATTLQRIAFEPDHKIGETARHIVEAILSAFQFSATPPRRYVRRKVQKR